MKQRERSRRLKIFADDDDTSNHRQLYVETVHRAHAAGLEEASVFCTNEAIDGSARIHISRLHSLSQDLPIAVINVDDANSIDAFLPTLEELVPEGLVTLVDVECIRYVAQPREAPR